MWMSEVAALKSEWKQIKLGDVAELRGRIGWRGLTAKEYTKTGPLFLSVHSLNFGDYVDFGDAFHITDERYDESPEIMLQEDDILICKDGAGIGKVGIVGTLPARATINSSLLLVRAGKQILPKFLYRCLSSPYFQEIVNSRLNGATTPHLYQRDITGFPIYLPPLPEQQRIVGILDKAFAAIATAKSNAERNLQNAREMVESHLQFALTRSGNTWPRRRLCDVVTGISTGPFGTMLHKSDYVENGVPLVNPMNIVDSRIVPSNRMMVNEDTRDRLQVYVLKVGDIVIARRGELGRCALVTKDEAGWLCGTGSFFLRLNSSKMEAKFFVALFSSKQYRELLNSNSVGTTMNSLNHSILNELPVPVPPIADQRSIMVNLERMSAEARRLESLYHQKIEALDILKNSLLHQAFAGKL